jgi:hypothetical protein
MASFLRETLGVADSGVYWDVGNFKLWQSTRDDVVLFIAKQPVLVKADNGRYSAAVSSYTQQQPDGNIKITGGSAMFAITPAIQFDPQKFQAVQDSWRAAMPGSKSKSVRFIPLNVQKGQAQVLINPLSGTPDKAHNDKDVGTPGGNVSFLVELTELGAQEWVQCVKNKTAIPAGVKFQYEYLRMLPPVGAQVILHGKRAFQHLSTALDVSYNGLFYGGSVKIDAAWENMTHEGIVEVKWYNFDALPAEQQKLLTDLTMTASKQFQQIVFDRIFAPKPNIEPAKPGNSGGWFGGANFALKWHSESESFDAEQDVSFEGMTWLKASMDAPLPALFADLDASYVTEVQTQQSFPVSLVVDSDVMLADTSVSMVFRAWP